jgi:hypothetical protein
MATILMKIRIAFFVLKHVLLVKICNPLPASFAIPQEPIDNNLLQTALVNWDGMISGKLFVLNVILSVKNVLFLLEIAVFVRLLHF